MNILGVFCLMACCLAVSPCNITECCRCGGIYIRNVKTGLVMTVRSEDFVLVVMDKPRGSCEQIWEYKNEMLYNKKSGLVLTAGPGESHISILKMQVPNGKADQKWKFPGNGAIVSGNGFTIDVWNWRTQPGTEVIGYYQTHLGHNQIFETVPVP